jgi:hypothetical protein
MIPYDLVEKEATVMDDQYVWYKDLRIIVPIVLSPGIVKIVLAIIGAF